MFRTLIFLALLAGAVALSVWLADHPGNVTLQWQGYRVDTSFAILLAAVSVISMLVAFCYRLWLFIRRSPKTISDLWGARRRRQGYQALTKGMVAVAAGDADEAARLAKRAEALLNEPPLTMLLSAQAAQLNGDEEAAKRFFQAMCETPETEFLGIRGLLTQAEKRGDSAEALSLARRAYRLRPKSDWVVSHLFNLQSRQGLWLDASVTGDEMGRLKLGVPEDSKPRKAVLAYLVGAEALRTGDEATALKKFRIAHDADPTFSVAAVALASLWQSQGKPKKVRQMIEKVWRTAPHPHLVDVYLAATESNDPLARVKASEVLAALNPGHPESHIAIARSALTARLWGEARKHLGAAGADEAALSQQADSESLSARLCRMMAELEEAEHGNTEAARQWLVRATQAHPDPLWVCGSCGNAVPDWTALCGKCGDFNRYSWQIPPQVKRLSAAKPEPKPETTPALVTSGNLTETAKHLQVDSSLDTTKPSLSSPSPDAVVIAPLQTRT